MSRDVAHRHSIVEGIKQTMTRKFALDRTNGKLLGVCAGIANYTGVDALLVRIGFVVAVLVGFGFPLLLYPLIALLAN